MQACELIFAMSICLFIWQKKKALTLQVQNLHD